MRPQGEYRTLMRQALSAGAGTSRELAARVQVGLGVARMTLDNMVRAEQAERTAPVKVPGVRRPVPVYRLPSQAAGADAAQACAAALREAA